MNAKPKNFPETWVDPDDAPELTDDFFENGVWSIGGRVVSRSEAQAEAALRHGRPPASATKVRTTIRFDADVLTGFKATGRGWQARMNDVLREWLNSRATPPANHDP